VLQAQILYVNSIARQSTIGPNLANPGQPNPDVDSYVNAFGVFREQASAAMGQVVFSVNSPPMQPILIPAVAPGSTTGVIVQTIASIGGTQFIVIIDTTNPNYNATLQGYVIAAGTTSVSATVQCLSDGVQGNVAANQITQVFAGPGVVTIAGIAAVNNPLSFAGTLTSGVALETDTALISRFAITMQTGTVATSSALAAAILGVQLNLTYSIGDGLNASGGAQLAHFTVVVNNAGVATAPSSNLIAQVLAVMNVTRAAGISCQVIAPTLVACNIVANVQVLPGFLASAVVAACAAAYTNLANNVGLDPQGSATSLKIAAVYATLYNVPGVRDITGLTLNGGTVDVPAAFAREIVAGSVSLSPY
jgi:hypothetical protein